MNSPALSILIPTFNRERYLANLLNFLKEEIYNLDFDYEIIISDNASTDNTRKVIESFKNCLNIKAYFQQKNLQDETFNFIVSKATGDYFIQLNDDDLIDFELLNLAFGKILNNPNVVALYTPWQIWDYTKSKTMFLFYNSPEVNIKKDDFNSLGEIILKYKIFPEIGIFKTKVFKKLLPFLMQNFFFAFKYASELITQGDIIFANTPYYKSTVNYSINGVKDDRVQGGFEQVITIYYKYRNSFFHLFRLMEFNNDIDYDNVLKNVHEFYKQRLLIALDISLRNKKFLEAYEIASMIIGEFKILEFNIDFETIKYHAKLFYLEKFMRVNKLSNLVIVNLKDESKKKLFNGYFEKTDLSVGFDNYHNNDDDKTLYYVIDEMADSEKNKIISSNIYYEKTLNRKFI